MITKFKKTTCLLLAGMLLTQSVTINNELQVVKAKETVTTNAEANVLKIGNTTEFDAFIKKVNAGETFEGKTVQLTSNIAYDGVTVNNFNPITSVFSGVFDGAGHSISGIIMVEEKAFIFDQLVSATVKNLVIKDCDFDTSFSAVGLANSAKDSKIQNCKIGDNVILKAVKNIAGFVLEVENCEIENCVLGKNATLSAGYMAAGIAMDVKKSCLINCNVLEKVVIRDGISNGYSSSGITNSASDSKFVNCTIAEDVSLKSNNAAAGIINTGENSSIISCNNAAMVTGGSIAAGIVGEANNMAITNCFNKNLVETTYIEKYGYRADAAGIVGNAENCTINNCYNQGMITALSSTGGIVADAKNTNILNSINKGRIIGKKAKAINYGSFEERNYFNVGGIAAAFFGGYINNCSNQSDVEGYFSKDIDTSYLNENNYDTIDTDTYIFVGGLIGKIGFSYATGNAYRYETPSYIQNCFHSGNAVVKNRFDNEKKNTGYLGYIDNVKTVINNTCFSTIDPSIENDNGIAYGAYYATIRNVTSKTTIEMQSPEFLDLINHNRGSNTDWLPWVATDDYPTIEKCGVVMVNNTILGMYEEGTTVTFKAVPSTEEYQISTPIINEGVINYQDNGDGTYSFIMPAGLVQVDYEETKIIITPTPEITPVPTEKVTVAPEVSQTPTDDGSDTPAKTSTPVSTTNVAPTLMPTNTPAPEPVITPKNNKLVLYVGGNTQSSKKYNVTVSNLSDYSISYKSSAPAIASVSADGKIVAKNAGTTAIFVDVKDKVSGKVTSFVLANVTVKKASLTFAKKVSSLKVKKTATFKVKKNGITGTVKWSVSNKKLASISSKGVLKGKKAGKVKVTATCGKKKATATVKIKK